MLSVRSAHKELPLPSMRRLAKPTLVLFALAGLAFALSACALFKEGSLQMSQPAGIGNVRVHFAICTDPKGSDCNPNTSKGQFQYLLGISVPKGSAPPATITAAPVAGGAPIVFSRNDQVAQEIADASAGTEKPWPPAGSEGVGYLSSVYSEEAGVEMEWTVDADFGLPPAADGGSSGGPFSTVIFYGARGVDDGAPETRPVHCYRAGSEKAEETFAACGFAAEGSVGTSDLKIAPPAATPAYLGAKVPIAFAFDFASSAAPLPSFGLTASSTLPKAKLALPNPVFASGAPDPATHRSPAETRTVSVQVPKTAKPGLYDVTITAATPQGGTVSQVAKLKVTKPKIKLGKLKLNKAKGTGTLFVKVPAAGTVTLNGKGLAKAKRTAKGPKTLKVPVKPNAKSKAQLAETGKAKVKAKVSFKPTGAAPVVKAKGLTLKKTL
jgi:hypothetical protein